MNYSRVILVVAVAVGAAYSLGYLSPPLRSEFDDKAPIVGLPLLFLIGACVGVYAAGLLAPSSFLTTHDGKWWMRVISGTESSKVFRGVCFAALLFFLFVTYVTLYIAFVFNRD